MAQVGGNSTFWILLFSISSHAADLFTLVDDDCKVHSGLILEIQEQKIELLNQSGQMETLDKSTVKAVLIYKGSQKAVHNIKVNKRLQSLLKDIYLADKNHSMITGWPIGFIENMVILFDLEGKTHLIELNQILKFRASHQTKYPTLLNEKELDTPLIGEMALNCNFTQEARKGIPASQVMVDLIKIEELFTSLEHGFETIESFEERNYFYAKPYLFEQKGRFGVIKIDPVDQGFENFPSYFQSASGEPYRFQTFWKLGGGFFPESPSLSNPFSYYTEAKSHLFHGVFLGNLGALSAGKKFYSSYSDLLIPKLKEEIIVGSSYNYMAMMGLDYENWSISAGTFYPIYLINVKKQFREVLASKVSPIFRVRFMSQKFEASLVYAKTEIDKGSEITEKELLSKDDSLPAQIDSFNLSAQLIKMNLSYQAHPTVKLAQNLISLDGRYAEVYAGTPYSVRFQNLSSQTEVAFSFGDYITVRTYIVSFLAKRDINMKSFTNANDNYDKITYGGALEFVF